MEPSRALGPTLDRASRALQDAGIRFAVTGGLASSFFGEPRFTQDIDIVLPDSLSRGQLALLQAVLGTGFFLDLEEAISAVANKAMFTALDTATNIKVDFHVGEAIAGEIGRAVRTELLSGLAVPAVTREDLILAKLLWITKGRHMSRQDVVSILRRSKGLNVMFLDDRAQSLGVAGLLGELRAEAAGGGFLADSSDL